MGVTKVGKLASWEEYTPEFPFGDLIERGDSGFWGNDVIELSFAEET